MGKCLGPPHAPGRVGPGHHILVHIPGTTAEPLEKAVFPPLPSDCGPGPHTRGPPGHGCLVGVRPLRHPVPHLPASRVCDVAAGRRAPWGGVDFDTGTPCNREVPQRPSWAGLATVGGGPPGWGEGPECPHGPEARCGPPGTWLQAETQGERGRHPQSPGIDVERGAGRRVSYPL